MTTRAEADRTVGMVVFVAATTVLFATLVLVYLVERVEAPAWPPPGTARLPVDRPLVALGVLAASSATLFAALHKGGFRRGLVLAAALLGVAFLGVQLETWSFLRACGVGLGSPYGATIFLLTGIHAAHVAVGVVALALAASRARATLVGIYWHFVGAVWVVLFAAMCLP